MLILNCRSISLSDLHYWVIWYKVAVDDEEFPSLFLSLVCFYLLGVLNGCLSYVIICYLYLNGFSWLVGWFGILFCFGVWGRYVMCVCFTIFLCKTKQQNHHYLLHVLVISISFHISPMFLSVLLHTKISLPRVQQREGQNYWALKLLLQKLCS